MQTGEVRGETGIRDQIAIISPSYSSPAESLSVLQPTSIQAGGILEVCSLEPAAIMTAAEVECLLSSGIEGKESAVNAYTEDKLENFRRSGLEQLAEISESVM